MTRQEDPNSQRSKRRANRNFTGSRPQRRAERRLSIAINGYKATSGETKPGAQKPW